MKRLLLIFLSLLFLFCGCSSAQSAASSDTKTTVLRIALWDYNKTSYDRSLIQAFEEQNPDTQIEVISYTDTYYEGKLSSLLDSGQSVDVIYFRDVTSLQAAYRRDQLLPMDRFIDALPLNKYRGIADLQEISNDGLLYAMPYRWDHSALYFNRDLFDRAEIPYPTDSMTWDEFSNLALRLKKACKDDEYPLMLLPDPMQNYWQMCIRPIDFTNDDLLPITELAALINRFQLLELMPPYAQNLKQNVVQRLFENGAYGMYLGGTWYMNYLHNDEQAERFWMNWGAVNAPVWTKDSKNEQSVIVSSIAISKTSSHALKAWDFVNFATGAAGAEIMAQERMVPAYIDENVSRIFSGLSRSHYISEAVYSWDNAAPVRTLDETELKIRSAVFNEFIHAVTGNKTVKQALTDMNAKRTSITTMH